MARGRTPRVELHKPELLEEHEKLEKAVKVALAVTALAGVYHHFSKNGRGYTYLRPTSDGKFEFEIGMTDFVASGKLERVRRLFGIKLSDNQLTGIENPENLSADEIDNAFSPDIENDNPLQTDEDSL